MLERGLVGHLSEFDRSLFRTWLDDRIHGRQEVTERSGNDYRRVSTVKLTNLLAAYNGNIRDRCSVVTKKCQAFLEEQVSSRTVLEGKTQVRRMNHILEALEEMLEQVDKPPEA
jgi:hypothetical protein